MSEHAYIMDGQDAQKPFHYADCGLQDVYLLNGYEFVEVEGERGLIIHNMDGLHATIGLVLVEKRKLIGPRELRFLRKQMDLTQAELGTMLGVSDQTVARWEKGETEMSGPADKLLRVLYLWGVNGHVDPRELFAELAEMDATNEGMMFVSTDDDWVPSEPLVAA